jgi:hypothetical protein
MLGDDVVDKAVLPDAENASDQTLVGIHEIMDDLDAHQAHRHSAGGNTVHSSRRADAI